LLGLILAGLVWLVLNERNLSRLLGTSRGGTVFRAALIGVPLPLCSCSVLPVAGQLRASGLSRGGTVSFLIATPESSIDSILLTWSLTDPLLTVARPVAAFLTASVAGLLENRYDDPPRVQPLRVVADDACCSDCGPKQNEPVARRSWVKRTGDGLKHSFTTLIADLAPYLLVGYLLAGLSAAIFGSSFNPLGAGHWWPYLTALIVGIPLYICATSSTPLAAVLLGAGFPPGAVLVFLMVGPATNIATLTVTRKILGMASTVRYLLSIVVVSLLLGLVLDWAYDWFHITPVYSPGGKSHAAHFLYTASGLLLAGLILYHSVVRLARKLSGR
jgi:hypothetical protein